MQSLSHDKYTFVLKEKIVIEFRQRLLHVVVDQLREVKVSGADVFTKCNELHLSISGRDGGSRESSFHIEKEIIGDGGVNFHNSSKGGCVFGTKRCLDSSDMYRTDHFIVEGFIHLRVNFK